VLTLHRAAQRLLGALRVVNPFAERLTFLDDRTRTRRDHDKYLTIIEALALMHQHQRPVVALDVDGERTECVEVELSDIELANRLAGEVLGRTLDELPPQTRRFLEALHAKVTEIYDGTSEIQRLVIARAISGIHIK
jgi:DNA primase